MTEQKSEFVSKKDRSILRDLSHRVVDISNLPIMSTRREMWKRHNQLEKVRPMILVFPEGSWRELLPDTTLQCEGTKARQIEWQLRSRIYYPDHIHDDMVIEKSWVVPKRITVSNWGLEPKQIPSKESTGAWAFDPVILDRSDLKKLRFPSVTYDAEGSKKDLVDAQDLLGDILDVKQKGVSHISFHLLSIYSQLRGLENVLWDMADRPEMVHEAMRFLEEGYRRMVQQYLDLNLLSLNNDDTYHSSGGVGYTNELPKPDYNPACIRPCDMWASAEAQELHVVSPSMHSKFALPYEKRLLEPFGLNGYGCCEDLTAKLDDVFTIPNIRRISISPFANVDKCAEKLQNRYIFSWKPQPAHLVGDFNLQIIRDYIRHTLDVTRGCVLEIILKDTHTCENHPERFTQWTDIAQDLVQNYA
jgi:hypothetical protein